MVTLPLAGAKISSAAISTVAAIYGTAAAAVRLLVNGRGYRLCRLGRTGSSKSGTGKNDSGKGKGFCEMHPDCLEEDLKALKEVIGG